MAAPPPNFQALDQAPDNIGASANASVNASVNALQNLQADLGTVQQEPGRPSNQPTNQNLQNQLTQLQQTVNDLRTELRSRDVNNDARMKNHDVTTRIGALEPLVHPITGQNYGQWLAAPPNLQPNWVSWQAWLFPPDMAAVYAIQRRHEFRALCQFLQVPAAVIPAGADNGLVTNAQRDMALPKVRKALGLQEAAGV